MSAEQIYSFHLYGAWETERYARSTLQQDWASNTALKARLNVSPTDTVCLPVGRGAQNHKLAQIRGDRIPGGGGVRENTNVW